MSRASNSRSITQTYTRIPPAQSRPRSTNGNFGPFGDSGSNRHCYLPSLERHRWGDAILRGGTDHRWIATKMVSTRTGAGDAGQRVAIDPNDPAYSTPRSGANVRGGAARETQTQDPALSTPMTGISPRPRFNLPPLGGVSSTGGIQQSSSTGRPYGGGGEAASFNGSGGENPTNQGGPQGGDANNSQRHIQRNISHRGGSPTITLSASMVCQRIDDIERTSTDPNVAVLLPTLRTILGLK